MSDLSTKKDPLDLRDERPDGDTDLSEVVQPDIGTDPQSTGSTSIKKPTVHVDMDKAKKAEAEGKGF